ncbi:c-type cytochrome [Parvularcula maris]|uniref:Cytochrome c family protein n=1 Tax=Parvularcula maris TaxID=2965077 RepID=A0A9X2L9Z2_9PROT|nr:cytochrome c family protein [Parvularcula maris]MCQ8185681.1 cytochrome c family protein [Parvularcula maris]
MTPRLASLAAGLFLLAACAEDAPPTPLTDEERLTLPPDLEMGQRLFRQCGVCHDAEAGLPHRVGPNLHGVVGAEAGRHADFAYSRALQRSELVWNEETLSAYLEDPRAVIPGGRMAYGGMPSEADRRDLIAYLKTKGE